MSHYLLPHTADLRAALNASSLDELHASAVALAREIIVGCRSVRSVTRRLIPWTSPTPHAAKRVARSRHVPRELESRGIVIRAASRATLDEGIPEAYNDVSKVVGIVHAAGIGRRVAQLEPVGVVKG